MNLNTKQWLGLIGALLSVMIASTAQLTDIFGAGTAKYIISIASMVNAFLQTAQTIISTQTALVKDVQSMPGVESIQVNKNASPVLAQMAVDPAQAKVDIKPGDEVKVNTVATGG